MKILVTGANGQLGYDVCKVLQERNIDYIGTTIKDLDFTDYEMTKAFIEKMKPDAIIHCGAYTSVDKAEDEESECYKVNIKGTENIANVCKQSDIKLMYISTDYVFSGTGDKAFEIDDQIG